jgi:WD40 repeat protein
MGVIRRLGLSVLVASSLGCAGDPPAVAPPPPGSAPPQGSAPPSASPTPPRALSPCERAAAERGRIPGLLAAGRLDRTVRVLRHADALCPASATESLVPWVRTLAELGRIDEAQKVADAIDARADAFPEAKTAASAARDAIVGPGSKPVDPAARAAAERAIEAALVKLDAGQLAEARRGFLGAWALDHPNGEALYYAGRAARESGDAAEAQRLFDRAMVELEKQTGKSLDVRAPPPESFSATRWTWSGDGRFFAVAQDQTLSIRDRRRGFHETMRLPVAGDLAAMAFSPDGKTFAYASDGACVVRRWDLTTGLELGSLDHGCAPPRKEYACPRNVAPTACPHRAPEHVDSVVFSPDGKTLASSSSDGESGGVRMWDAATGAPLYSVAGASAGGPLVFSPDGSSLLGIARGERALSSQTWLPEPTPEGRAAMGVRMWQAKTGRQLRTFARGQELLGLAVSPRGDLLATLEVQRKLNKTSIDVWDLASGRRVHQLPSEGGFDTVAFSADGKELIAAPTAWDVATWTAHPAPPAREASPDGKLFVRPKQKGQADLELADAATGSVVRALTRLPLSEGTTLAASSRDGATLVSGNARTWAFTPAPETRQLRRQAISIAISPEGALFTDDEGYGGLLSFRDGSMKNLDAGEPHHAGFGRAFSPDGKVLATGGRRVTLTDVATGRTTRTLEWEIDEQGGGFGGLAFSPDGQTLAVSTWGSVQLWDLATGRRLHKLPVPLDEAYAAHERDLHWSTSYGTGPVTFSPDGKRVASGTIAIRLWDVATGAELGKLGGHERAIASLAFSPDGKVLATGSEDRTVRLWDLATGTERRRLSGVSRVYSVFFSPDGKTLVSSDGCLRLWTSAGDPLLTLTAGSRVDAGVAISAGPVPRVELLGPDADRVSEALSCQAGGRSFPFELCRERFLTPGLAARRAAGDASEPDP